MKNKNQVFIRAIFIGLIFALTITDFVFAESQAGKVLVSYGFDDKGLELDGNRLFLFQNATGHVGYSSEFALSGYQSIELQEGQYDEEFTELQGRFPEQKNGLLRFHFAILVENPEQELNIAVAGHQHFRVEKDGIAFWLHTQNGVLIHETNGIPKKLFSIDPFQWYFFDIVYNIDTGKYDLFVDSEKSSDPLVALRDQPNSSNNPHSGIDRFSFIGDLGDRSTVHYFIDDVVLTQYPSLAAARSATEESIKNQRKSRNIDLSELNTSSSVSKPTPIGESSKNFTARRGYLDAFLEVQTMLRQTPRCLPAIVPSDVGLSAADLNGLLRGVEGPNLEERIRLGLRKENVSEEFVPTKYWVEGCILLRTQKASEAKLKFLDALKERPKMPLFQAALALANAASGDSDGADAILLELENVWSNDPRLPALKSFIHSLKGNYSEAKNAIELLSTQVREHPDDHVLGEFLIGDNSDNLVKALRKDFPNDWKKRIDDLFIAQNYYYNLLWSGQFVEARTYAHEIYSALDALQVRSLSWREREADAAYFSGNKKEAMALYQEILERSPKKRVVWRKLLDVAHQLNDREFEQSLRKRFAKEGF